MSEYVKLDNLGLIISNIGNRLIENQKILKCVKFDSSDALSQPDIDIQEIINLVGKGDNPKEQQRIFKTPFNNTIIDSLRTELRFYIPSINPDNVYLSKLSIVFQIIIHNTLWDLDDNNLRAFVILNELLKELNGQDIGGIGLIYLNQPARIINYNDNFSGYMVSFGTRLS